MSENTNEPELPESDRELESLLQDLKPDTMNVRLRDSLHREYRITAAEQAHDPTHPQWRKVIPLTVACVIVMLGYASFRFGPDLRRPVQVADTPPVMREVAPPVATETGAIPSAPSAESFLPVSAQGYVVHTASGGVVETDQGPRERVRVEYRDAYHWHDPETGTNIRVFRPRNEEIIVPLQTD